MTQRILVAYATKRGSTAEVAQAVGDELGKTGAEVDVQEISTIKSVDGYHAVVVGSAVRVGKWLPETVQFIKNHHAALSKVPVAYFVVCITLSEDTPENRKTVLAYLDPVREEIPDVKPVEIGLFAGVIDMKKLPLMLRFVVNRVKAPKGDFRDWANIRQWAKRIRPSLAIA
jgi:menaquinone-dependent protoporphyrinogen oxidase